LKTGSSPTGGQQPATETPKSSRGSVYFLEPVAVPVTSPLKSGKPLAEIVRKFEQNATVRAHLETARRQMVASIPQERATFRTLRLAAGLSQTALAEKAGDGTTQSYIARIEAGSLDPGTDLINRLALALSVVPEVVFAAVRRQRSGA